MTITDFHITYQIPLNIIKYAITSGMLYINSDHLIEDTNFKRFLAHSELFTEVSMKTNITTFWKRCALVYKDKNFRIYDHRKTATRNYYTVFTRDGLIETFSSNIMAKRWALAQYAKPVRQKKLHCLFLTLEQMDFIVNSGACATRQDIVDKVNQFLTKYTKED